MSECVAGAGGGRRLLRAAQLRVVVRRLPEPLAVAPLFACLLLLGTAAAKGFGLRRSVSLIDYTAQLHVRAQRLSRGLAVFRRILRSVRIQASRPPSAHWTPPKRRR